MSRLDDILDPLDEDRELYSGAYTASDAKEKIKALFLELIGEDAPVPSVSRDNLNLGDNFSLVAATALNGLKEDLRNKIEEL